MLGKVPLAVLGDGAGGFDSLNLALVGIGLSREVRVRCDLPSRQTERRKAGTNMRNNAVAGEGSAGRNPFISGARVHVLPQRLRPALGQRALHTNSIYAAVSVWSPG